MSQTAPAFRPMPDAMFDVHLARLDRILGGAYDARAAADSAEERRYLIRRSLARKARTIARRQARALKGAR